MPAPNPTVITDFLACLRRRDHLITYLEAFAIPHRGGDPDHPHGVRFEWGDEGWCADYHPNGNFKALLWR